MSAEPIKDEPEPELDDFEPEDLNDTNDWEWTP